MTTKTLRERGQAWVMHQLGLKEWPHIDVTSSIGSPERALYNAYESGFLDGAREAWAAARINQLDGHPQVNGYIPVFDNFDQWLATLQPPAVKEPLTTEPPKEAGE